MTRQDVPPLLTLSGAVLEAQWDRVGHITSSDRCRRPVGREKKKKPRCLIFGTRTILPCRPLKNAALDLFQKCSKSASARSYRPIWKSVNSWSGGFLTERLYWASSACRCLAVRAAKRRVPCRAPATGAVSSALSLQVSPIFSHLRPGGA